jgi:hypothetical protein
VSKGISAVPVVEVGKDRLTGNATSEQLAALIERGLELELELARTSEPLGVA